MSLGPYIMPAFVGNFVQIIMSIYIITSASKIMFRSDPIPIMTWYYLALHDYSDIWTKILDLGNLLIYA